MRGLLRAGCLLAPTLASSFAIPERHRHEESRGDTSAVIHIGSRHIQTPEPLNFRLDVLPSTESCGYGNVTVDGQVLPQSENDAGIWTGQGPITLGPKSVASASWTFECLENGYDSATVQYMRFQVNTIDGSAVENVGFAVIFKQDENSEIIKIIPELSRFEKKPDHSEETEHHRPGQHDWKNGDIEHHHHQDHEHEHEHEHKHGEHPPHAKGSRPHGFHHDLAELKWMKSQLLELEWMIYEKEQAMFHHLQEHSQTNDDIKKCDSLKCVLKTAVEKARGAVHHAVGKIAGGPEEHSHHGHHGFPRPPPSRLSQADFEKFGEKKHGNHTWGPPKGNHTHPHFHKHPLPVCRFPPPHGDHPPHFGGSHEHHMRPGSHHGPPPQLNPEDRRPVGEGFRPHVDDFHHTEHDGPSDHHRGQGHHDDFHHDEHVGPAGHREGPPHHDEDFHHGNDFHHGEHDGPFDHHGGPPHHNEPGHEGPFHGEGDMGPSKHDGPHHDEKPASESSMNEFDAPPPHGSEHGNEPPHGPPHFDGVPEHKGLQEGHPFDGPPFDGPPHGGPGPHGPPPHHHNMPLQVFKWSIVGFLVSILLITLRKRNCTPNKRAQRQARHEKRELRRAHRREVHKSAIQKLLARMSGNNSPSEDDEKFEQERMLSDAEDGMSGTISQLQNAAAVVGEIVAASPQSPAITVSQYEVTHPAPMEQTHLFLSNLYSEDLPAYEDNDGSEASSIVADGFQYTPGSSEYSPSHSSSGSLNDILGSDTKK